jgi:hypothetical protein
MAIGDCLLSFGELMLWVHPPYGLHCGRNFALVFQYEIRGLHQNLFAGSVTAAKKKNYLKVGKSVMLLSPPHIFGGI